VKNSLAGIPRPQGSASAREVFYMPWLTTIKLHYTMLCPAIMPLVS